MPVFSAKLHFRLHRITSGKIVEEKVKVRSHVTFVFVLKSTFLLKFYIVSTVMQTKIMRLGLHLRHNRRNVKP